MLENLDQQTVVQVSKLGVLEIKPWALDTL